MFKVGEFARMSGTSVKTLHHYDEIGLLRPARVDPESGYRYYAADQLVRLGQIRTLKDFGFSLDQIGLLIGADLSSARMVELLRLKQNEIAGRVQEEQERLDRVTQHLRQLESATAGDYPFEIRAVPAIRVAAIQRHLADTDAEVIGSTIRGGFMDLYTTLGRNRITPGGPSIIYWQEIRGENETGDIVMATPVEQVPASLEADGVFALTLPAVETMAVLTHQGPLSEIGIAYLALFKHIEADGYRISGARRDVVIRYAGSSQGESVSELQFPVEREDKS